MNDMSAVIVPKSDQINADDLIAGPMTITVSEVKIRGGQEQPVSIFFEGSDKAFRPCKSMSRVLVAAWGPDANQYVGRSLTLYRDPSVKWAGMDVGGIRISHMTHIEREMVMALTEKKGSRKPTTIKPLIAKVHQHPASTEDRAVTWTDKYIADLKAAFDNEELASIRERGAKALAKIEATRKDLYARIIEADPLSAILPATGTDAEPASTSSGEQAAPGQGGEA